VRKWSNNPEVTRQKHSRQAKKHKRQNNKNLKLGRGKGGANNRNKHECKRGHEFTVANTFINVNGARVCVMCRRLNERSRYANAARIKNSTPQIPG